MLPLRWSDRGDADLTGIVAFVSSTSEVYAEALVEELDRRLQLLRAYPDMGKPVRQDGSDGVRELVVASHRVFYVKRRDALEVVAIVHGRQQTPDLGSTEASIGEE